MVFSIASRYFVIHKGIMFHKVFVPDPFSHFHGKGMFLIIPIMNY